MAEVLDMIRQEHQSISRMLNMLEHQIERFERGERFDYDLVKEVLDYFVTFADLCHHPKENLIIAKLRQRAPELAREIGDLDEEHERISKELHDFAHAIMNVLLDVEMPRDRFVRIAHDFIAQERKHMAEEEARFLPVAEAQLTDKDWAEISAKIGKFLDPLLMHRPEL